MNALLEECDALLMPAVSVQAYSKAMVESDKYLPYKENFYTAPASITGLPVVIPTEKEAACLGCAIIGAVADGIFPSYQDAADKIISFQHRYEPVNHDKYEKKYQKYCALYEAMLKVTRL